MRRQSGVTRRKLLCNAALGTATLAAGGQDNRFRVAAWFGFNDPEMRNFVIRNPFAFDGSTLAG